MASILRQETGPVCEPCIALNSGIEPGYWEGSEDVFAHCEAAAEQWGLSGTIVLNSTEEEPQSHYGGFCIVCGDTPYMGTVYDYTFTILQ